VPDQALYTSSETFNITAYFEDLGRSTGITGATITVQVNGAVHSTTVYDNGDGYYNITIDCSHVDFGDYGSFIVRVNASKTYYTNQTDTVPLEIRGDTATTITKIPDKPVYDSGEILNITVYFNDTAKNQGIIGANITVEVKGTPYYTTIFDNGDGYYNITLNLTDPEFSGYGVFDIRIDTNLTFYINHTDYTDINIYIVTETTVSQEPYKATYDSGDALNISIYYNDTVKNLGISGANISIWVNGAYYSGSTTIFDYGNGNYNITIDFTDSEFAGYGQFNIRVDVNLTSYYNSTDIFSIDVLGETATTVSQEPYKVTYNSGDALNISVYYNDTVRTSGISGAIVSIWVNEVDYTGSTIIFDYGNGYYNITIDFTDSPFFDGYGQFNIRVDVNLTSYYNSTDVFSIDVLGETATTITKVPDKPVYDSGEILNITVYFNDTAREQGIIGANITVEVEGSPYYTTIFDNGDGYYNITIDLNNPEFSGYGVFNIRIDTNLTSYINHTDYTDINIYIPTQGSLTSINQPNHIGFTGQLTYNTESGSYLGWIPYNIIIKFSYRDINNSEWIETGKGTLTINGQYYIAYTGTDGICTWDISTSNLIGTYPISITMMKDNWETVTFQFYITMGYKGLEISNLSASDYGHELEIQNGNISDAYIGNNLTIQLKLQDNITGFYINESNVILNINDKSYEGLALGSKYYWIIPTDDFSAQIYNINITFFEDYFINRSILYTIEFSEKYEVSISLYEAPDNVIIGETLNIKIKLYSKIPIANENVTVIFNFGGGIAPQIRSNITNKDGIVSYSILIPEGAEYVNITVLYEGSYKCSSDSLEHAINLTEAPIFNFWLLILLFLILGVLIVVGIIVIKRRGRIVKDLEVHDDISARKKFKSLENQAKQLIMENQLLKVIEIYKNALILSKNWGLKKEYITLKEKIREINIIYIEDKLGKVIRKAERAVNANQYIEAASEYRQAAELASNIFKLGVTEKQKEIKEYKNKAEEYEKKVEEHEKKAEEHEKKA